MLNYAQIKKTGFLRSFLEMWISFINPSGNHAGIFVVKPAHWILFLADENRTILCDNLPIAFRNSYNLSAGIIVTIEAPANFFSNFWKFDHTNRIHMCSANINKMFLASDCLNLFLDFQQRETKIVYQFSCIIEASFVFRMNFCNL